MDFIDNYLINSLIQNKYNVVQKYIRFLITLGFVSINKRSSYNGLTPLEYFISKNNVSMVKLLLECGADPNILCTIDYYIDQVNEKHSLTMTPLTFAIGQQSYNIEIIKLLILHGANLNCTVSSGHTPLLKAIERGCSIEIVKLLLDSGADVNLENSIDKGTPLIHVTMFDTINIDYIKLLLKSNPDIDKKNIQNKTIFDYIQGSNQEQEVLELLGEYTNSYVLK